MKMTEALSGSQVLHIQPSVIFRIVGEEAIVCDTASGLVHAVNQSAAQILLAFDEPKTVDRAIQELADQYNVDRLQISSSVYEVSERLIELGLLGPSERTGEAVTSHLDATDIPSTEVASSDEPRYLFDPPST